MSSFKVSILTPDRECYNGEANKLIVRTLTGDVGILKGHINYVAPLGIGEMRLHTDSGVRIAAVSEGFITVLNGEVSILAQTVEWADEINVQRAEKAKDKSSDMLNNTSLPSREADILEIKLKRAINRISVSQK